jgi:lipoprotein-anchoring transpeptidase ErfK/SrfK
MRFPLVLCFLALALAAPLCAKADVIVGPVPAKPTQEKQPPEEKAKPAAREGSDERGRIFERIGIKIIRKGSATLDESNAKQVVESLISEGASTKDDLLKLVREESPVVMTSLTIDLSRQRLFAMNKDGQVLAEYKVSTGRAGYETPQGNYKIVNKAAYAYSKKYEADMFHWMGITSNGDIGLHGLKGGSYERRLGRRASHGCIRLSRADAQYLFSIIPVGMPVKVTSGLSEVVYYKPISEEDLMGLIDELLSTSQQSQFVTF